jgi:hypothetical protein
MPSSEFYTLISKSGIDKHSFETGEFVKTILSNETLTYLSQESLTLSKVNSYAFS